MVAQPTHVLPLVVPTQLSQLANAMGQGHTISSILRTHLKSQSSKNITQKENKSPQTMMPPNSAVSNKWSPKLQLQKTCNNNDSKRRNPYTTWWDNITSTKEGLSLAVIVDDNARNFHKADYTNASSSFHSRTNPVSPVATWNPEKDSVVGFASNKNRWSSSISSAQEPAEQTTQTPGWKKKHHYYEEDSALLSLSPAMVGVAPTTPPPRQATTTNSARLGAERETIEIRNLISRLPTPKVARAGATEDVSASVVNNPTSTSTGRGSWLKVPPAPIIDESPNLPFRRKSSFTLTPLDGSPSMPYRRTSLALNQSFGTSFPPPPQPPSASTRKDAPPVCKPPQRRSSSLDLSDRSTTSITIEGLLRVLEVDEKEGGMYSTDFSSADIGDRPPSRLRSKSLDGATSLTSNTDNVTCRFSMTLGVDDQNHQSGPKNMHDSEEYRDSMGGPKIPSRRLSLSWRSTASSDEDTFGGSSSQLSMLLLLDQQLHPQGILDCDAGATTSKVPSSSSKITPSHMASSLFSIKQGECST